MDQNEIDAFGKAIAQAASGAPPKVAARIEDVPTERLATNFVGSLIRAKGNLNEYQALAEMLIRELRHEPHPTE